MSLTTERPAYLRGIVRQVTAALMPRAVAIFLRNPQIDPRFPQTSDLDLLVFAQVEDLRPEGMKWKHPEVTSATMIELTWLPSSWLRDPEALAAYGLISHRLLGSDLVFDAGVEALLGRDGVRRSMYRADVQQKRLAGFLEMGFLTVQEIGVT